MSMNRYGVMARRHWARWLPRQYAAIGDPESVFTMLGEEVARQIDDLIDELAGDIGQDDSYLARVGQLLAARAIAEGLILPQRVLPEAELAADDDQDDQEYVMPECGEVTGVAAALMALVAYESFQVATHGALGPAAQAEAAAHLGVNWPWWAWALVISAVVTGLGLARVEVAGRVLAVLTAAEIAIVLAETISGLTSPAGGHLDLGALSPSALTASGAGTLGVLAVIAGLAFVGFEQSPVLGEEARNARRTISATTYTALAAIGVLYAAAAWAMQAHAGPEHVAAAAAARHA